MTVLASFDMNELLQIWLLESDGHRVIPADEFIAVSVDVSAALGSQSTWRRDDSIHLFSQPASFV